jgi:hypothetical protein
MLHQVRYVTACVRFKYECVQSHDTRFIHSSICHSSRYAGLIYSSDCNVPSKQICIDLRVANTSITVAFILFLLKSRIFT